MRCWRMTGWRLMGVGVVVALAPGSVYFVQSVNGDPAANASVGPLFWVSDTGVRYGINTESGTSGGEGDTIGALGLSEPALPIPWSVLSQFAVGPVLSRGDALLAHDGLAPDGRGGRRVAGVSGAGSNGGESR
ncbi:type VII secretion protein EccB [Mycolicibacter icosiumassiliensis]|uniref:type VII secretion protein EccB n=1 Tax=Mycolicibacter icosiumassiliensis TaxID=1792835 RepID=UPI000BDEBDF0|nr:type VII secretion protein EccB [Mycolicibacter icosiumassiliensis]